MIKPYNELHQNGVVSYDENFDMQTFREEEVDFGIQIAEDGRVWICINGISFIRFRPVPEGWKDNRRHKKRR